MTQGPSRDHTEQYRTQIIKAMSSDVALSVRVTDARERMSCPVRDAEPIMKKKKKKKRDRLNARLNLFHPWYPHDTPVPNMLI